MLTFYSRVENREHKCTLYNAYISRSSQWLFGVGETLKFNKIRMGAKKRTKEERIEIESNPVGMYAVCSMHVVFLVASFDV